ncbi:MAG: bile acid:sodium symporter family protein, partial [Anaerolineales bacterium]
LTMKQITGPLRNARFVIVALLANFVLPVILALILNQVFSLDESLAVGLLLVSLAAGAPALPKTAVFAKIDTAAAIAMLVLLVVLNVNDMVGLLGAGGLLASLILIILTKLSGSLL